MRNDDGTIKYIYFIIPIIIAIISTGITIGMYSERQVTEKKFALMQNDVSSLRNAVDENTKENVDNNKVLHKFDKWFLVMEINMQNMCKKMNIDYYKGGKK